jgi:biopolymer transport protein ExbB/TolQ
MQSSINKLLGLLLFLVVLAVVMLQASEYYLHAQKKLTNLEQDLKEIQKLSEIQEYLPEGVDESDGISFQEELLIEEVKLLERNRRISEALGQ